MTDVTVVLLGTGTPMAQVGRYQAATAVIVGDQPYIIDCGGGAMQRLVEACAQGHTALASANLTRLFLTHLHPDHTVGIADFIIAPWVDARVAPVHIYGPPGTRAMVDHLLAAFAIGIGNHQAGAAALEAPLAVVSHEFEAGVFYEDDRVAIEAFPVAHSGLDAYGFKLVAGAKSVVHSGDTAALPIVAEKARGCDLLIHEVFCEAALAARGHAGWSAYHRANHTSTSELAAIAGAARPGRLVLIHQLYWGEYGEADIMREVAAGYDGPVAYGHDLDSFTV